VSTQHINFQSIEAENPPVQLRPFVRFPFEKPGAVAYLARAIDFEACAGRAVKLGQLDEADHLRSRARRAWTLYREASRR
jgi:hypothetical protein